MIDDILKSYYQPKDEDVEDCMLIVRMAKSLYNMPMELWQASLLWTRYSEDNGGSWLTVNERSVTEMLKEATGRLIVVLLLVSALFGWFVGVL